MSGQNNESIIIISDIRSTGITTLAITNIRQISMEAVLEDMVGIVADMEDMVGKVEDMRDMVDLEVVMGMEATDGDMDSYLIVI